MRPLPLPRFLTAALAMAVLLVGQVPPAVASARPGPAAGRLFGTEVRRLPTDERVVAMTFNAGWDEAGLARVLRVLRAEGVPATFFPTGRFAERHPRAVRAMAAAGFGLGNHSYSHPRFGALSREEVAAEVLRADRVIRAAGRTEPLPFFRFPYSETTPRGIAAVNALGFADIEFTADTNGYLGAEGGMTVREAVRRALDALVPGAVVQMHVGSFDERAPLDPVALPLIIDGVRARGYRFTDLRAFAGAPCPFTRSGGVPHRAPYAPYMHVTLCA